MELYPSDCLSDPQCLMDTITSDNHWAHSLQTKLGVCACRWAMSYPGVYTHFSGRLSEEPFPWLMQKFLCINMFKTGQTGCQLNLSEGQIRLDLMSGRPLV